MPSAGLVSETQVMRQEEPGRGDPIGPLDWRKILPFEPAASSDRLRWVGLVRFSDALHTPEHTPPDPPPSQGGERKRRATLFFPPLRRGGQGGSLAEALARTQPERKSP
jgi:hypothetical protein